LRHLYREKNGRYYVRIQFPKAFQRSHPHLVSKCAEIRLSLYSTNHVHARELAHVYWLASRKLVHSDLQALGILTIEDFKSHLRRSVTTHLPQKFTPLIELIGSTETAKLVIAVKTRIQCPVLRPSPSLNQGDHFKEGDHIESWLMGLEKACQRERTAVPAYAAIRIEKAWL
jgi:hypothetical protein